VRKIGKMWGWFITFGPTFYLAWFLIQPELEIFKGIWHVALGITVERFVEAVVVGAAIFTIVHFLAKRFPWLNHTAWPRIERWLDRAWPHTERFGEAAWPPIWRSLQLCGRWIARIAVAIWWYALRPVFMFIWRVLRWTGLFLMFLAETVTIRIAAILPERRLPEPGESSGRRSSSVLGGGDPEEYPRSKKLLHWLDNGSWLLVVLWLGSFLGFNEMINDPRQPLWESLVKIGLLVGALLLLNQTYRLVLTVFMLECYLLWASYTQGVKVGTVYMLLFGASYLLWKVANKFVLAPNKQGNATDPDEED